MILETELVRKECCWTLVLETDACAMHAENLGELAQVEEELSGLGVLDFDFTFRSFLSCRASA